MALVDFLVFRTRRAKTQGRFFEKSGFFLDFFQFAIFLMVLVYWILHDGKIIFSPKNPFPNKSEHV